jgi:hypothetical protein
MQLTVSGHPNQFQQIMQGVLFPTLQEQLESLTDQHRKSVSIPGLIQVETLLGGWPVTWDPLLNYLSNK